VPSLLGDGAAATTSRAALEARLQEIYCGALAAELSHVHTPEEYEWLTAQLEGECEEEGADAEWEVNAWKLMARSEEFDHFMGRRFAGVKRYGLEGLEPLVAGLHTLLGRSCEHGLESVVVGMAHRGRLNLLAGLLGMGPEAVFHKAGGGSELPAGEQLSGDVLSHLGVSGPVDVGGGRSVHSTLLHNPSHLELVDPVTLGKVRAKQEALEAQQVPREEAQGRVAALIVHGDAAMVGQGVVPETMQLSALSSFTVGGALHVVTNNQLGFTAAPTYGRSSRYPTCAMHATGTPVLHANVESLAAVRKACRVAADYRAHFRRDVVVNLIGYRRHGHNELDEPAFTQPTMYRSIRARSTFPQALEEELVRRGLLSAEEAAAVRQQERELLDAALRAAPSAQPGLSVRAGHWTQMCDTASGARAEFEAGGAASGQQQPQTGADLEVLRAAARASVTTPDGFAVHKRLRTHHCEARLRRAAAAPSERTLDWATAEAMALGALLADGHDVRFCGQDAVRGTFSHRHLGLADQNSGERHYPFGPPEEARAQQTTLEAALGRETGRLHVMDSPLSELAVLGYEYGMSLETPQRLCIWEAQFGDFVNAAQMVVDQFLATSDEKWGRQTALTLLLPHGMDGAGPEHSTCRVERFLQLCNDPHDQPPVRQVPHNPNLHVLWPSTPASYFHMLRRQQARAYRKPAVIVGPKTLLRNPEVLSSLDELAPGTAFRPVLADPRFEQQVSSDAAPLDPAAVQMVVCCSGRVYYDLAKQLREMDPEASARIAVVRLEEVAPFPQAALRTELARFPNAWQVRWVQEEHANMGAWSYVRPRLHLLSSTLKVGSTAVSPLLTYVGRDPAAAVTGLSAVHKQECAHLQEKALKFRARK
jgi:2-oxoadipate dehydrogenase E1 component